MVQFVWGGGDSYGRGFEAIERKGLKGGGINTDSQALMKSIGSRQTEKGAEMDNLRRTLMLISIGRRILIQLVAGRCGEEGSEWADREANLARSEGQENEYLDRCKKEKVRKGSEV